MIFIFLDLLLKVSFIPFLYRDVPSLMDGGGDPKEASGVDSHFVVLALEGRIIDGTREES